MGSGFFCPVHNTGTGDQSITKDDKGKLRYALLPPEALEAYARVTDEGATKYGERNWEKGGAYTRLLSPLMRHLEKFRAGERVSTDGTDHMAAVMFYAGALITWMARGVGLDDRCNPVYPLSLDPEAIGAAIGARLSEKDSVSYYNQRIRNLVDIEMARVRKVKKPIAGVHQGLRILVEEVGEFAAEISPIGARQNAVKELVQVAATAIALAARIDEGVI
jgi:hypothetical protein